MKLATLLELHRKHSGTAGALGDAFGDGFLLKNNLVYRKIREGAKARGFRYATEQNDAYRVLPLSQLDQILATKVIPYFDNVSVLEAIEKKIPQVTVWDDISDNLKGNAVFHESSHAVAQGFPGSRMSASDPKIKTLFTLLEESFANTCELLSIIDAGDQAHRIFVELNSYVYMLDSRPHLKLAAETLGLGRLSAFLTLCYLHSNLLQPIDDKSLNECLALAAIEAKAGSGELKNLRALAKVPFELNIRFREVTTRFHLNLSGAPIKAEDLRRHDFLKMLASGDGQKFLRAITNFF